MQAGKVIELVHEWALRPERIAAVLAGADAPGRHLLALVYASEDRGATEAELLGCLDGFPPSQALMLLGKLEQDLLLYSREGEKSPSYHGFQDLAGMVLPSALADLPAVASVGFAPGWFFHQ